MYDSNKLLHAVLTAYITKQHTHTYTLQAHAICFLYRSITVALSGLDNVHVRPLCSTVRLPAVRSWSLVLSFYVLHTVTVSSEVVAKILHGYT